MDINNDAVNLYQLNQILKQLLADIDNSFSDYIDNISNAGKIKDIIANMATKKLIISYLDSRPDLEVPIAEVFTDEQINIIKKLSIDATTGDLLYDGKKIGGLTDDEKKFLADLMAKVVINGDDITINGALISKKVVEAGGLRTEITTIGDIRTEYVTKLSDDSLVNVKLYVKGEDLLGETSLKKNSFSDVKLSDDKNKLIFTYEDSTVDVPHEKELDLNGIGKIKPWQKDEQYTLNTPVTYERMLYICTTEPQADPSVFNETEWLKVGGSGTGNSDIDPDEFAKVSDVYEISREWRVVDSNTYNATKVTDENITELQTHFDVTTLNVGDYVKHVIVKNNCLYLTVKDSVGKDEAKLIFDDKLATYKNTYTGLRE